MNKKEVSLAYDIISESEGEETFWFMVTDSLDRAKKTAEKVKKVLEGTGTTSGWQVASNYSNKDYGIAITDFTEEAQQKLIKKYNLQV